jgi:hypothetical protein
MLGTFIHCGVWCVAYLAFRGRTNREPRSSCQFPLVNQSEDIDEVSVKEPACLVKFVHFAILDMSIMGSRVYTECLPRPLVQPGTQTTSSARDSQNQLPCRRFRPRLPRLIDNLSTIAWVKLGRLMPTPITTGITGGPYQVIYKQWH